MPELANRVMKTSTAMQAKALFKFRCSDRWLARRLSILEQMLVEKSIQNSKFKEELIRSTGYSLLHTVHNHFWGSLNNGQNQFGKLLEKVRTIITSDPKPGYPRQHSTTPATPIAASPRSPTPPATRGKRTKNLHIKRTVAPAPEVTTSVVTPEARQSTLSPQTRSPAPEVTELDVTPDARRQSTARPQPSTPAPEATNINVTPGARRSSARAPRRLVHQLSPISETSTPAQNTRSAVRCQRPIPVGDRSFRHPKTNKKEWVIYANPTRLLVIGDSNISNITQLPNDQMCLQSYPGGTFRNLRETMQRALDAKIDTSHIDHVVFSLGINCRRNNITTTAIPELRTFLRTAAKLFPTSKLHMVEINYCNRLSPIEKDNLENLNREIRQQSYCNYIRRFTQGCRFISDNIHWQTETANCLLRHWVSELSLN
jgi:hypothetical protein